MHVHLPLGRREHYEDLKAQIESETRNIQSTRIFVAERLAMEAEINALRAEVERSKVYLQTLLSRSVVSPAVGPDPALVAAIVSITEGLRAANDAAAAALG